VRAGLEAIAMQNVELIELLRQETGHGIDTMRVDGGAATNNLLMQLQADYAGVCVERPFLVEATALGAARLAALQLPDMNPSAELALDQIFEPDPNAKREAQLASWRAAVARIRS
jgi:glycerol kinase